MTDIIIHNLQEQLDRIEQKLDGNIKKDWLTTVNVVSETGLSLSTVNRAIKSGQLKVARSTGKNMFRKEWVDKWISG
jgi:hypothetical protein